MGLKGEAGIDLVGRVVDERLPLLRAQIVREQIPDQGLDSRVAREEDVRPVIEDEAVDLHRPCVASRTLFLLEQDPVGLA